MEKNIKRNQKNSTIISIMVNAATITGINSKKSKKMITITQAVEDTMITIINIMITIINIIMNIKYRTMVEMQVLECRLLFCMHYVLHIIFSWHDHECRGRHFRSSYIFPGQSRKKLYWKSYRVEPLASLWPNINLLVLNHSFVFDYPCREKLLSFADVKHSQLYKLSIAENAMLGNRRSYRRSWYSRLGFKTWKNLPHSTCVGQKEYWKESAGGVVWYCA